MAPSEQQKPSGGISNATGVRAGRWLLTSGIFAGLVGGLRYFEVLSATGCAKVGGILLAVLSAFWGGRVVVHICGGYWQYEGDEELGWTESVRRQVTALVAADVGLTLSLIGSAAYSFFFPSNHWLLVASAVQGLLILASAKRTVDLIQLGGPRSGSKIIGECKVAKWIRGYANVVFGEDTVDEELRKRTRPSIQLSWLVITVLSGVLLVSTAQAVALGSKVIPYLNGKDSEKASTQSEKAATTSTSSGGVQAEGEEEGRAPERREETYEEICGRPLSFDSDISGMGSTLLEDAFEALGQPAVGCIRMAKLIQGDAYVAMGYCKGDFRSLGILSLEGEDKAGVLIEHAALLARRMLNEGRLLGASNRTDLGEGDFYLVFTVDGTYLLIREHKTDGNGGPNRRPFRCEEVEPGTEKYQRIPPGVTELWVRFNEEVMHAWPQRDTSWEDKQLHFTFEENGATVARVECSSLLDCELHAGNVEMNTSVGRQEVSTVLIEEVGPG